MPNRTRRFAPARSRLVGALVIGALAWTSGCGGTAVDGSASAQPESSTSADPTEPTEAKEPTPPKSAPAVKDGASIDKKYRVAQDVTGIVSWDLQPGKGLTVAQAKEVGDAADVFITEHYLRRDRWQGGYAIKPGEMDDVRARFTRSMFGLVKEDVDWWRAAETKFGADNDKWPKGVRAKAADHGSGIGGLFVTTALATDGKGPIRAEMTRKVVYVGSETDAIMAYCEVTGRRVNNTGQRVSITIKLNLDNVKGKWLVDGAYWDKA
jgi:hypothetical protein